MIPKIVRLIPEVKKIEKIMLGQPNTENSEK
jgi:hypothetical protein